MQDVTYDKLVSKDAKAVLGEIIFATATDGNHGRAVAWAAQQLGHKAIVYMPKGSSPSRVESIRDEGAEVHVTNSNYDDTVRLVREQVEKNSWVLFQDTAWEGYEEIPTWTMQGYGTVMKEILEQINESGEEAPTHVFLQAGVGTFSGSMLGYLASRLGEKRPVTVIMESDQIPCLYHSIKIGDGRPHNLSGDMNTIMAGLTCGEPNIVGWGILRDYAQIFVSCPDTMAALGMRTLANPLGNDARIISGESGAVGMGLLVLLAEEDSFSDMAQKLGINPNSRILLISTEGDTDPQNFLNVVWKGAYGFD